MKTKHTILSVSLALTQSAWIRPTLMTVALLVAILGVAGCSKPHH